MDDREALRQVVDNQVALGHAMTIVPTSVLVGILSEAEARSEGLDALREALEQVVSCLGVAHLPGKVAEALTVARLALSQHKEPNRG